MDVVGGVDMVAGIERQIDAVLAQELFDQLPRLDHMPRADAAKLQVAEMDQLVFAVDLGRADADFIDGDRAHEIPAAPEQRQRDHSDHGETDLLTPAVVNRSGDGNTAAGERQKLQRHPKEIVAQNKSQPQQHPTSDVINRLGDSADLLDVEGLVGRADARVDQHIDDDGGKAAPPQRTAADGEEPAQDIDVRHC